MTSNQENSGLDSYDQSEGNPGPQRGDSESPPQGNPESPPQEDPESPPQGNPESPPQEDPKSPPQEDPKSPPQEDPESPPQEDPESPPQGAPPPQGQAYPRAPGVHPGQASPAGVITGAPKVGKDPVTMECSSCRAKITTRTESSAGVVAWYTSGGMFLAGFLLCGIPWLCCCFPFCGSSMQDTTHHCPYCGNFIGKHRAFLD